MVTESEQPRRDGGGDTGSEISFPGHKSGPLGGFGYRVLIASACIVVTTLVVYLGRHGYRDVTGQPLSFLDSLYFATVSLSTTGYGDIVPVSEHARELNILIITPLRIVFLIVLIGSTLEVLTARTTTAVRETRWRKRVHNHTIIIGYGVKGRAAASTLREDGIAVNQIVVVCSDPASLSRATAAGFVGILGNARDEEVLRKAGADRAASVIVCADSDDTSVLVTLTVRRLNPAAAIVAASRETHNTEVLRQSGANGVIPTAEAAGRLMAMSLLSPTAGELMEDLLNPRENLEVIERLVEPNEVGLNAAALTTEGQLLLAVLRDGTIHRFDEDSIDEFAAGDRLVVIRHAAHPVN